MPIRFDEERAEFISRHGGQSACRRISNSYYLMPDGALLSHQSLCESKEPPADEAERAKLVLRYQKILYEEAVEDFKACERQIRSHFEPGYRGADGHVVPTFHGSREVGLAELRKKRQAVWNQKYQLQLLEQRLDALLNPPHLAKERAKRDKAAEEEKAREVQFFDELRKITI
jgi:hypothetical protein